MNPHNAAQYHQRSKQMQVFDECGRRTWSVGCSLYVLLLRWADIEDETYQKKWYWEDQPPKEVTTRLLNITPPLQPQPIVLLPFSPSLTSEIFWLWYRLPNSEDIPFWDTRYCNCWCWDEGKLSHIFSLLYVSPIISRSCHSNSWVLCWTLQALIQSKSYRSETCSSMKTPPC